MNTFADILVVSNLLVSIAFNTSLSNAAAANDRNIVFLNGKFHIRGEVWEVSDKVLEQLDAIEGYPDFYNKQVVHTTQGKAWMYFLPDKGYEQYKGVRGNDVREEGDTLVWR